MVDGTGAPGRPADVAVTDGRISDIGKRLEQVHACSTPAGQVVSPRLRRHPHPLRRPGVLGPGLDAVVVPRGDDGDRGELRVLHRARPARRRAAAGAHAAARRGHELRHAVRRRALGRVRDLPPVPRRGGGAGHGAQLRLLRRPHGGAAVRHGRRRPTSVPPLPRRSPACRRVVADAMAGGAAGFASSASPTHNGDSGRPVPSRVADLAELRALLEPREAVRARRGGAAARWRLPATRRSSGSNARWGAPSPGRRCSR